MRQESTIHFKNKPFLTKVDGSFGRTVKVTPVIFENSFGNFGMGLMYFQVLLGGWGLGGNGDLITSWRATELVRYFTRIYRENYVQIYYSCWRNYIQSEEKREEYLYPVIEVVGQSRYDEIMNEPVPEEIIQMILNSKNSERGFCLHPIASEIKAGTISWRREFADFNTE